jgi:hypothetical protein
MPDLMDIFLAFVILILGVLAGASSVAMYSSLEKRIHALEQASDKRHLPYKTAEEIENAMAALLIAESEIDFKKELLDNAIGHLKNARNNRK